MADKLHHPAKPNPQPPLSASKHPPFNRPIYQSQPHPHSSNTHCLRACCCSIIFALFSLIFLIAIAGGIFYAIYRPHSPTFSISSLRLTTSSLNITVTARNPNRQIVYSYDQISVSISSNGVGIGEGSFPGFVHSAKNTTVLSSSASAAADLRKSMVPLELNMETKARMKIGRLKTKRFGMEVYCDGIQIAAPKRKKATSDFTIDSGCRVKLRMKIWKWTV